MLALPVRMLSGESHRTSRMKNQQWFSLWLGAHRQQAITRVNVDPDLCRYMASLSHTKLMVFQKQGMLCCFRDWKYDIDK